MFNFNEKEFLQTEQNGLALVEKVEKIVDGICTNGYSTIFYIGIGGTIAYARQVEAIVKSRSTINLYIENAADFVAMGNKHFNKDSIVVIESISGDTKEIVAAVDYAHEVGAKVIGFVEKPDAILSKKVDYVINSVGGTYCYWYTVSLRFMYHAGDFPEYDAFYKDLQNVPQALCEVQKAADAQCEAYADTYKDEPIQYLVASGNLEGWAYCYAMCILEEMQWMRTKSISGAEFFHGTLEVIDRDTSVILFKGEDEARPLMDRVEQFVNKISAKVTVFDTKDYELKGIRAEFRGLVSPFVMRAICQRISVHLEHKRRHPLAIRRYYRRLDY